MRSYPPWSGIERIAASCTGCGDCVTACPEAILVTDQEGRPRVDFHRGSCTFCGACADACKEGVFTDRSEKPWPQKAIIGPDCLLASGISCQICRENCPEDAFRFDLSVRPAGAMNLETGLCTGCGACVAPCPTDAIAIMNDREDGTGAC